MTASAVCTEQSLPPPSPLTPQPPPGCSQAPLAGPQRSPAPSRVGPRRPARPPSAPLRRPHRPVPPRPAPPRRERRLQRGTPGPPLAWATRRFRRAAPLRKLGDTLAAPIGWKGRQALLGLAPLPRAGGGSGACPRLLPGW